MKSLAQEVAPSRIRVNSIAPGAIRTPINRAAWEAEEALRDIMEAKRFGDAGSSVVIEEFMTGDEISVLTFCDGKTFKSFPPCQDHKRALDGNLGPNTGGMGVYAQLSFVTSEQMTEIDDKIIRPTLEGMRAEGKLLYNISRC